MNNNQTATQQVVETILKGIEKGTFKLGQKIPSQRKLSEMFGVSRMVIREAIKILEGKGILLSKRGSGIYVQRDISELENISLGDISDYNLADVYSLSNEIWVASMRFVVENATDDELMELNNRVEDMNRTYDSGTTLQSKYIYESSFGMTICKMTHNDLLYKLMVSMLKVTSDLDYELIKSNDNYKKILEMDAHLMDALMSRDTYRAQFWANERNVTIAKIKKINESIKVCFLH